MSTVSPGRSVVDVRPLFDKTKTASGLSPTDPMWGSLIVAVSIGANAAMLIAQQVAIRLLAPLIGSSIETWSTIIGVFLVGIAIGNRIAGKLADRYSPVHVIASGLLLGAVSVMSMPLLVDMLAASPSFTSQSLFVQILAASTMVCVLPGIALSLVTPPSVRSLVTRQDQTGSVSGRVFAWGTFGSLLGNYLAGFVLLALLGVRTIVGLTSGFLVVLSVVTYLAGRRRSFALTKNEVKSSVPVAIQAESSRTDSTDRRWYLHALITVTACSFVSGAVEGAAFRILAPLVGVSMFLSAGVVGVVLAGMSLGNALGGYLASRFGSVAVLRKSLFASAIATLAVAPLWKIVASRELFAELPLIAQIVGWSFSLFFLPALALGTITPQVIRLSIRDVRRTGAITGQLYAWSTLGCIAGIMIAAWFMIEAFGAIRTSILCGIVPVALMWLIGWRSSESPRGTCTRCVGLLFVSIVLLAICKSPYERESRYFAINVEDGHVNGRDVKRLVLDRLLHSMVDLDDPGFLYYKHEVAQGALTQRAASLARNQGRTPRILVIGGGGYTFPRWVEAQSDLNDMEIDVVEIDPEVTQVAHDRLGLPGTTRIRSINVDGRQFVKTAPAGTYDLVIQDAVNDLSVPYHLMTVEYNALIKRLLRPDGLYLLTVIDSIDSGRFLASAFRTVESKFDSTKLLVPKESAELKTRAVFMIAGCNREASAEWWSNDSIDVHVFPNAEVQDLIRRQGGRSPLLTDDYAPVDILMSGEFLNHGG